MNPYSDVDLLLQECVSPSWWSVFFLPDRPPIPRRTEPTDALHETHPDAVRVAAICEEHGLRVAIVHRQSRVHLGVTFTDPPHRSSYHHVEVRSHRVQDEGFLFQALAIKLGDWVRAHRPALHSLTFAALRAANAARGPVLHRGPLAKWSVLEWAGALAGEVGEAANLAKKLKRVEDGVATRASERDAEALRAKLADELGDVQVYLDLLALRAGIDLGAAVARKFDATSAAFGLPHRLGP